MIGQEYLKFKRVIGQKDRPAIKKLSDDVSSFNKAETINNKSKSIVNLVLSQPKGVAGNSVPPLRSGKDVHSTFVERTGSKNTKK